MTAYTSSSVDFAYQTQEGEIRSWVLHMDRLNTGDTLDLTPYKPTSHKICFVDAEDHASTITNDVTAAGVTTSTANSRFATSMVVSTDVVTFTGGGNSTDAHIMFKTVPSR